MTASGSETEYVFQPFESIFLARRNEIERMVNVSAYAMQSMEGAARLSEVLRRDAAQIERVREVERLAQEEVRADFPLLHSAGAVLIWGALEAAIRDFLVRWLARRPSELKIPEIARMRVPIGEYEPLVAEDRMRLLVNLLEKELAATLKPGPGRFECVLKPFSIAPKISDEVRRDLCELAAVRNVIVHRAGIADIRFLKLCPWLKTSEGQPIDVTGSIFARYVRAASEYAAATVESATERANEVPATN